MGSSHSPTVQQWQTIRLSSPELSTYKQLPELVKLINKSFMDSWRIIPGLVGPTHKRYDVDTDYIDDMGQAGVVYVMLDEESNLVATAGYKPWRSFWKHVVKLLAQKEGEHFKQQTHIPEGSNEYEVCAVAVLGTSQKKGLAGNLFRRIEEEVTEKTKAEGGSSFKLLVRTGKENNERYWTSKGFETRDEMFFKPGSFDSKTGFTILEMYKDYHRIE